MVEEYTIPYGDRSFYSSSHDAKLNEMTNMKLKQLWNKNYEANYDLIKEWGGFTDIPVIKRSLVVGAGWGLEDKLPLLSGIKAPIIVTDKAAPSVAAHASPFAITAVNTERTGVSEWLSRFRETMREYDRPMEEVYLVCPVTVHPDTFKDWEGKISFVNPSSIPDIAQLCEREFGIPPTFRGMNVGTFSMTLSALLNASEIAMIGMPFSFLTEEEALVRSGNWHVLKIRDLNNDWVYTTLEWLYMRKEVIDFCMALKSVDVRFINCSGGGILYEGGVIEALPFKLWRNGR